MSPADRIALVERLARAAAWNAMTDSGREAYRRRASDLVHEIEVGKEQLDRVGWILVELDPEDTDRTPADG